MTWSNEPGQAPDARAPWEYTNGENGANGYGPNSGANWTNTPAPAPMSQVAQSSALTDTAPRTAIIPTPEAQSGADPNASGAGHARNSGKRKKVTDSASMPALRLNRRTKQDTTGADARPRMVYDADIVPGHLRWTRLGIGLLALVVAWGVSLLVVSLAEALWTVAPHQPVLTERYALDLIFAVGILWLAVVTLAMIVVGAFSLSLALFNRGW